ncbi:MAG TPA: TetR/AcrR family transcriptional regulator [Terracidiphilus sp.]|jgi:TetR/AcrR family transcriptional regulator|nr:TetR/AcrR family transcriptional regulator [Terracidiphilus sp.]
MKPRATARNQTERADQTRARILDAAIQAFSENGLAGARTEHIADAAGVNKALLYYYYKSKEALYEAALEQVAGRVIASSMAAIAGKRSAGERLVQFVLSHFDRIHSQRAFQSLMQQELMRLREGRSDALTPLMEKVFRPMIGRVTELLKEGMRTSELIRVDEWQMMYAALGANVFFFLSGPVIGPLAGKNLFERRALRARRQAAIEYLGQTIFVDRRHGARVAARVLNANPMPPSGDLKSFEVKLK